MRAAKQFETVECPLHLAMCACLRGAPPCWKTWATLPPTSCTTRREQGENAAKAILHGLESLAAQCENLIVVSNEVFSGGADYAGDTDRYLLALAQVKQCLCRPGRRSGAGGMRHPRVL